MFDEAFELDAETQKSEKPKVAAVLKDFPRALYAIVAVMELGASKPGRRIGGWAQQSEVRDFYFEDPLMRHWLAQQMGETFDPESGELHKAHLACNALMDLEMTLRGMEDADTNDG